MTLEECKLATIEHINTVRKYIRFFTDKRTEKFENSVKEENYKFSWDRMVENIENLCSLT